MAHTKVAHEKQIHLPKKKLRRLILQENSCFCQVDQSSRISLSPSYINNISQGLKDTLNAQLYKYNPDLNGIVVAVEKVKVLNQRATIFGDEPNIFLDVSVSYVIFKPELGVPLSGTVNKIGQQHIGCIVHDVFNASVRNAQGFVSNEHFGDISIGDLITFTVTDLEPQNDILSIKGELITSNESHRVTAVKADSVNETFPKQKKKKSKKDKPNSNIESETTEDNHHGNNDTVDSTKKRKKKKKKSID